MRVSRGRGGSHLEVARRRCLDGLPADPRPERSRPRPAYRPRGRTPLGLARGHRAWPARRLWSPPSAEALRDDQHGHGEEDRDHGKDQVDHPETDGVHMVNRHVADQDRPHPQRPERCNPEYPYGSPSHTSTLTSLMSTARRGQPEHLLDACARFLSLVEVAQPQPQRRVPMNESAPPAEHAHPSTPRRRDQPPSAQAPPRAHVAHDRRAHHSRHR